MTKEQATSEAKKLLKKVVKSSKLLYGVVEWISDKPMIDDIKYFTNETKAEDYANEQTNLHFKATIKIEYTIIKLEPVI